jgi:hypothetical protein
MHTPLLTSERNAVPRGGHEDVLPARREQSLHHHDLLLHGERCQLKCIMLFGIPAMHELYVVLGPAALLRTPLHYRTVHQNIAIVPMDCQLPKRVVRINYSFHPVQIIYQNKLNLSFFKKVNELAGHKAVLPF